MPDNDSSYYEGYSILPYDHDDFRAFKGSSWWFQGPTRADVIRQIDAANAEASAFNHAGLSSRPLHLALVALVGH